MKYKIENCYYELIKDILMSWDSVIEKVDKYNESVIVTLKSGSSQDDLMYILQHGPLYTFCKESYISKV